MNVVKGRPPNFDFIVERFPAAEKAGTIFTYGDTVYVTGARELTPSLHVHEAVHVRQQKVMTPDVWWDEYVHDPEFRFAQELEAHRAEYYFFARYGRNISRVNLKVIAKRLASPLYGNMTTELNAKKLIKALA